MKAAILNLWRWCAHRVPEALLFFFLVALAPMVAMVALEVAKQAATFWRQPGAYWEALTHDPWPAASSLICVVGAVLVASIMWRNWTFVWAVARKLIIEALHRRVVIVLLVFFVVVMSSLPFILKTEGSLKSQAQLLLMYSLVLGMVLLCLLAIFVSAASICSEIEGKQVQVTDTKPLARWKFLLGKWFGVVVMCAVILFVMAFAAGVAALSLVRPPDVARMQPREAAKAIKGYEQAVAELFVSRRAVSPREPPGVDRLLEKRWRELAELGDLPPNQHQRERFKARLREGFLAELLTVPPGYFMLWHFEGLRPGDTQDNLFVRFTVDSTLPGVPLMGRWVVLGREMVRNEQGEQEYRFVPLQVVPAPEFGWSSYGLEEFQIPAKHVGEDGTLFLRFDNFNTRASASFRALRPMVVLQRQGGFWANYYRTFLVLLCHVALLAALGLAAGSIFSFPVASLTVVFIFVVGLVGTWFVRFLEPASSIVEYTFFQDLLRTAWRKFLQVFLAVMPHFGKYNPLADLTDGQVVTWPFVASSAAVMVFIKGTAATLIGMYFYARRELARVIV